MTQTELPLSAPIKTYAQAFDALESYERQVRDLRRRGASTPALLEQCRRYESKAYQYLDEGSVEYARSYIAKMARVIAEMRQLTLKAPTLTVVPPARSTPQERFMAMVEKTDGHWIWTGAMQRTCPVFNISSHQKVAAHLYAFALMYGQRPARAQRCAVERCVNPDCLTDVVRHLPQMGVAS